MLLLPLILTIVADKLSDTEIISYIHLWSLNDAAVACKINEFPYGAAIQLNAHHT